MDAPDPVKPVTSPQPPAKPVSKGAPLRRAARLFTGLFILLALFIVWQVFTSFIAYTDDAYVRSDFVALAPQITGHIIAVAVRDNQPVHQGDVLVKIDPVPFQLAVNAKQASLEGANASAAAASDSVSAAQDQINAASAELTAAQETEARTAALHRSGFASGQSFDVNAAALNSAAANLAAARAAFSRAQSVLAAQQAVIDAAKAELATAQWQLDRTIIRAPADGTVNNLYLQAGDTAQANTPLIGIIAANAWRIIANYKQSYLPLLKPGQTAWVWLDAHPWHFYRAQVTGIARGISRGETDTGLLPYVAPTTDWIRLQHRFPVTVTLVNPPPDLTLYMGADARCLVFP